MSVELKRIRVNGALGKEKADLVVKNAKIVNVFTKEIIEGDIAICQDIIVGVGEDYKGKVEVDAKGKYICPGLIDAHVHIESSMVAPVEFAKAILPHGTTTIIADPHEISNVCGVNGIHFMLNQTKDIPLNVYFMIPSSVPATSFENNGAVLNAEVMEPLVSKERILGLGEVMDYPSVINADEKMLEKIDLFDHKIIDGHAPNLRGKALNAYKAAGVVTDHECSQFDEVLERLRLGMYVQVREGSAAKNLTNIVKGLLEHNVTLDRCVFCTDDKHLEDIRKDGHISYNIKKAINCGVDPIEAICMATINPAECYRLKRLGAIAPGYSADFIILNNLEEFDIDKVYYRGKQLENYNIDKLNAKIDDKNVFNTVRIKSLKQKDLEIPLKHANTTVIGVLPHEILTKRLEEEVNVVDGYFVADETYNKIAVIERHKATKNIGLGIVKNFNIKNGAIASTVAHDSHNVIVIGDNDEDMLKAVEELKKVNGGYTVVSNGKIIDTLELPIGGIMSDKNAAYVENKLNVMIEKAYELGINKSIEPFIMLSFLALPVIPEIRVTDQGLFDVSKFDFIKL